MNMLECAHCKAQNNVSSLVGIHREACKTCGENLFRTEFCPHCQNNVPFPAIIPHSGAFCRNCKQFPTETHICRHCQATNTFKLDTKAGELVCKKCNKFLYLLGEDLRSAEAERFAGCFGAVLTIFIVFGMLGYAGYLFLKDDVVELWEDVSPVFEVPGQLIDGLFAPDPFSVDSMPITQDNLAELARSMKSGDCKAGLAAIDRITAQHPRAQLVPAKFFEARCRQLAGQPIEAYYALKTYIENDRRGLDAAAAIPLIQEYRKAFLAAGGNPRD